ncbi:MAG: ADP-ribosylglycohydrolase family protein [Chloroflexi bacterium]|nr:ADP-ribosylglycohydrolase family protein [Chloroflexota bacterium]
MAALDQLQGRAFTCLLAGLIGDAMGTPTENLEPAQIEERFGWVSTFEGDGTDDSLMKDLLSDALVQTDGHATADDWAAQINAQSARIRERRDKFFPSVLHLVGKLRYGYSPREVSDGNMPSSSSAMAIAPVGIVNAGHPRAAAAQAQDLASLIHTGDVSFCQDGAAAVAAAIAQAMLPGTTIEDVVTASTAYLKPTSGALMRGLIEEAVALAREVADYRAFREAYHARFRQTIACDSRETIPATIALCLLADGEAVAAVELGANFGRDSDTIATMAGAICGAFGGESAIPSGWLAQTPEATVQEQHRMARRLTEIGQAKAQSEIAAWSRLGR